MPLVTSSASLPMTENSSPSSVHKEKTKRTPLGTVLAPIGEASSSNVRLGRPVLGEKRVASSPVKEMIDVAEEKPRFPTAVIDVESISDVMAARLSTCLLGHVLFLKSQIPFPVAQLMKISTRKTDKRPNKKLDKLLASFDLLSSHLGSTFTALSNALSYKPSSTMGTRRLAKIHLAIVLGPRATAVNLARARVVLEFDGLYVVAIPTLACQNDVVSNSDLKENEGVVRSGSASVPRERQRSLRKCVSLSGTTDEDSDGDDACNSHVIEPPPESDFESDSEPDSSPNDSISGSSFSFIREETEEDLSMAERLLSRTLAIANADPELGMSADIRPTQIHILLHAPRRFSHPEWIPQQETSGKMDSLLNEFNEPPAGNVQTGMLNDITNTCEKQTLLNSGIKARADAKKKGPGGVKTDYVRVRSKSATDEQDSLNDERRWSNEKEQGALGDATSSEGANEERDEDIEDEEQDDELIWWSWADRLEGFTDL